MWHRTSVSVGGLAILAGCQFLSCSSSSQIDNGASGAGLGGSAGNWDASAGSGGSGGYSGTGGKGDGSAQKNLDADWDGQWPTSCGDSGVSPGPHPGGSPDCPEDLNLEGCPCHNVGSTGPCWPGERRNRNRGVCHDGTATCTKASEFGLTWGACLGFITPDPTASSPFSACKCFSAGIWHIDNLSPCFWGDPFGAQGAASTIGDGAAADCDKAAKPPALPSMPWSKNTLKVDCGGHFQLCYELKAGNIKNPQPSDCSLAKVCVEGDYATPGTEQPMPDLPAWSSADSACAQQFANENGYGEMSVVGMSVECDEVIQHVFHRVGYCSLKCKQTPNAAECMDCGNGQSGGF